MKRRDFLALPIGAALLPSKGAAQSTTRIGWVTAQNASSLTPYIEIFQGALRDLGYEQGRNLAIEYRFGNDDVGLVPQLAIDLVSLPVSILLVQGAAVPVVARMGLPIPVVFVFSGDPVSAWLAESLARPRQDMTGLTFMAAQMNEKRLEILRDVIPGLRNVALLANPEHPGEQLERIYSEQAGSKLGLEVSYSQRGTKANSLAHSLRLRVEVSKVSACSRMASPFRTARSSRHLGCGSDYQ